MAEAAELGIQSLQRELPLDERSAHFIASSHEILEMDGRLLLARLDSGADSESALFIEYASPSLLETDESCARVANRVRYHFESNLQVFVRVADPHDRPLGRVLQRKCMFLSRTWRGHRDSTDEETISGIRRAGPGDFEFCLEMTAKAIMQGGQCTHDAFEAAQRLLAMKPPMSVTPLIYEQSGQAAGLALVRARNFDPVRGAEFVEIIDVSVRDGLEGRGITRKLVRCVETYARQKQRDILGHVLIAADGSHNAILPRLLSEGWRPAYSIYKFATPD